MDLITQEEADQIALMRESLDEISKRVDSMIPPGISGSTLVALGRCNESVQQAESSLFRVLNIAASYLYDPVATVNLHRKGARVIK